VAFQTGEKPVAEAYCRASGIEFEWKSEGWLTTRQIRRAVATHPRTGETVWFNHATFFHVSTLEPDMRDALLGSMEEEELPNNTYYGDGSAIEPWVLDELREAYRKEMVAFTWQQADILLVDNMLTAHARRPYAGTRRVLVAMSDPRGWETV
jgi:alpha-ketoglutarate-dependent taurine dioxygenase